MTTSIVAARPFALCDDLSLSHDSAVLGMRWVFEGLDRLVV
jgi:hypothetical protein